MQQQTMLLKWKLEVKVSFILLFGWEAWSYELLILPFLACIPLTNFFPKNFFLAPIFDAPRCLVG